MIQIPFGSTTEWLLPESVVFTAEFHNNDGTNACFPATPDANCLFETIEVRMGGTLIERVTESSRCNELLSRLTTSPQKKLNLAQMGFGTQVASTAPDWAVAGNHEAATVDASGTKKIMWKCNLSGILSQHRWIPCFALGGGQGLVLNFYLAPAAEAMIKSHGASPTVKITNSRM